VKRALELVIQSVLIAAIVLGALILLKPWDADVTAAIAVHDAEPLDVNDSIIVRWETAEGEEVLPPEIMPLWRYGQLPQQETAARLAGLESALEHDIHLWRSDCRLMLTHDFIDSEVHIKNGDGGQ